MKVLRRVIVWSLLVVAVLAPLIANNRPLFASVGSEWMFPAFRSYLVAVDLGPNSMTWKDWWLQLDADGDDWAVMPLWIYHASEVDPLRIRLSPSFDHPLGCDDTGRDQLARVIHGAGTAVQIAIGSALVAMLIGVLLGALGGIAGGWVDVGIQRLIEVFACFPALVTVLACSAFFGGSISTIVLLLGTIYWSSFARITRGEILSIREREYVAVARGLGVGAIRLATRHILPVIHGPILVCAAFVAGNAIVVESTLSFLGLDSGRVSWGAMVAQGREHAATGSWHLWLVPAVIISVVVITLHGLSDELSSRRDDNHRMRSDRPGDRRRNLATGDSS